MSDTIYPIWKAAARGAFLKLKDRLDNPNQAKVLVEICRYDPAPYQSLWQALDTNEARRLSYLMLRYAFSERETTILTSFKGGKNGDYPTGYQSRVLKVSRQKRKSGNGYTYLFQIEHGAGKATQSGAVTPADGPKTTLLFPLLDEAGVELALALQEYMVAHAAAQFAELRTLRLAAERET